MEPCAVAEALVPMPDPKAPGLLCRLRFRLALWLWARILPLAAYRRDLTPLLELARPRAARPYGGLDAAFIVGRVKSICRRPRLMRDRRCLREGLLGYRFLCLAGHAPTLRFGVERDSVTEKRVRAHCWIDLGGEAILNPPSPGMIEIFQVGAGGGTPTGAPAIGATGNRGAT